MQLDPGLEESRASGKISFALNGELPRENWPPLTIKMQKEICVKLALRTEGSVVKRARDATVFS